MSHLMLQSQTTARLLLLFIFLNLYNNYLKNITQQQDKLKLKYK
jgi:hypothetical protein